MWGLGSLHAVEGPNQCSGRAQESVIHRGETHSGERNELTRCPREAEPDVTASATNNNQPREREAWLRYATAEVSRKGSGRTHSLIDGKSIG